MARTSAFFLIAAIFVSLSILPVVFARPTCRKQLSSSSSSLPPSPYATPPSHKHRGSASPPHKTSSKPSSSSSLRPKSTSTANSPSNAPVSGSDIDQYLSAHNTVRAQHGAAALTWSDTLASAAQKWADGCVFKHSGGSLGPYGENLAAGTGGSYDIAAAIKSWTDEVSEYDSSNPQPSHFTQVVWKATTQVGCAVQSCDGIFDASFGKAKYYVCEYSPQGNVIGEFASNVQA